MSYTDAQVSAATAAMDKYRGGDKGEVGAALVVVGLSAERAVREAQFRDEMIRVAHRSGASLRQLAEVSGLDRKTVTAIVGAGVRAPDQLPSNGSGETRASHAARAVAAEPCQRKHLFKGTADYYDRFGPPYPSEMFDDLRARVTIDAAGRLLDIDGEPSSSLRRFTEATLEATTPQKGPDRHDIGSATRSSCW